MQPDPSESRAYLRGQRALTGEPPSADPLEGLRASAGEPDPARWFLRWLAEAVEAGVAEPQVMTLSTLGTDGIPDARALVLKEVDGRGFAFASTASSVKGEQLAAHPSAALSFWWQPQTRAVRIRGRVSEASAEESLADLRARSPEAQAAVDDEDWRLWRVVPEGVEFWQGAPDRRHLRILLERSGDGWSASQVRAGG